MDHAPDGRTAPSPSTCPSPACARRRRPCRRRASPRPSSRPPWRPQSTGAAGDPLHQPTRRLGERDVAAQHLDEPPLLEESIQDKVQREIVVPGGRLRHRLAVLVDVPRRVVLVRRERSAVAGGDAVTDHAGHVGPERQRQLLDVGADLRLRALQIRVRVAGLLQLDEPDRQPVEIENHIEPAACITVADVTWLATRKSLLARSRWSISRIVGFCSAPCSSV